MHSGNQELEQLRQDLLNSYCDNESPQTQPLLEPLIAWLQASDLAASAWLCQFLFSTAWGCAAHDPCGF